VPRPGDSSSSDGREEMLRTDILLLSHIAPMPVLAGVDGSETSADDAGSPPALRRRRWSQAGRGGGGT
jgi:hypothetical protein